MIKKILRLLKRAVTKRAWLKKKLVEYGYVRGFYRVKVEDDLALFDCFWGRKVGGDPYALYREMVRQNPRLRCVWVRNDGVKVPADVAGNTRVRFVEHGTRKYADALLRSRYLVCNSNFLPFFVKRPGQIFVNTWHGTPLKMLGLDIDQPVKLSTNTQRNFNIADYIPLSGEYERRNIVEAYGGAGIKDNVREVGAPRLDLTLSADRDALLRQLGIEAGLKIILYAPTWRGSIASVSAEIDDQVDAIKELKDKVGEDYHLFVSLHHLTRSRVKDLGVEVDYVPDSIDINEFLQCVDVLVSDYSSITIDYLIVDRPVVLYVPDYEKYRNERGLYLDINRLPCEICFDVADLPGLVREARRPSAFKPFDEHVASAIPLSGGGASRKLIEEVLGAGAGESRTKPERKKVLIYPGALKNNGITSAFKGVVSYLAGRGVDVYVLLDTAYEKSVSSFRPNVEFCRDKAEVILANRAGTRLACEYRLFHKLQKKNSGLSESDEALLARMFGREVRRFLPDIHFDCVIDFSGYSYYWARFVAAVPATNRLIYQHSDMKAEFDNENRTHAYLGAVFGAYKLYDKVVSVSSAIKSVNEQELAPFYGAAHCVAVPNTIDFKRVVSSAQESLEAICPELACVPSDTVVFVSVSRLSHEKNISSLIPAFSQLVQQGRKAVLVVAGDGDERDALSECAVLWGVEGKVIFTGNLDNPYPVMKRADCLVFPSLYEGQGLVLLEAMSLGTFCIGSDIPAVREVLEGTGCWVVPAQVESLASAMGDYIEQRPCCTGFEPQKYVEHAGGQLWSALFSGARDL